MKRLIAVVAVALVTVSMVCAQITVGAKGNFGMNLGSKYHTDPDPKPDGAKNVFMVNGGGAIYGRWNMPFHAPLGFQLEIGITGHNGAGLKYDDSSVKVSYTSMDIPLLVTYDFPVGSLVITPMLGLNFSFPLGDLNTVSKFGDIETEEKVATGGFKLKVGAVLGAETAIPLGPGSITAGLSYVMDFSSVYRDNNTTSSAGIRKVLTRRNLNISVGYALKF